MTESMEFQTEVLRRLNDIEQALVGIDVGIRRLNGESVTMMTYSSGKFSDNWLDNDNYG